MDQEPAVRLQPPPAQFVKVVNPVVRRVLTSPLGTRLPPALAVLDFTGRKSGRRLLVPVGVHEVATGRVVFTEAAWARNFTGGREVTVQRGRDRRRGRGVLVEEPHAVADALADAVQRYGARNLAMQATPGREITHDDLVRLGRSMVRLELDGD